MARPTRFVLAVVLSVLITGALAAQEPGSSIRIQTMVGFNGLSKTGFWTPVQLQLQNLGPGVRGRLVVSVDRSDRIGPIQQTVRISRELDLPAGSTKSYDFVLPITSSVYPVNVSVYDDQSADPEPLLETTVDLSARTTRGRLVVALSRRANLDFLMSAFNGSDQRSLDIAYPLPEYLPSRWAGLQAVDLLVVHDARLEAITPAQWEALHLWTANGGTVVISGGPHLNDSSLRLISQLLHIGDLTRTGQTDQPDGRAPLAVSAGDGRVVVLPFDYVAYHRTFPEASLDLWGRLLTEREQMVQLPISGRRRVFENELMADILALPSFQFPSKLVLLALLGVYLVILATVAYLAYVRRHRRPWRFLTTAVAAAVLFSALGVVVLTRRHQPDRALQLSLEQTRTHAGAGFAEVNTDIVLFSRTAATYRVTFDHGAVPIPLESEDIDLAMTASTAELTMEVRRWGHRNAWLQSLEPFAVDGYVRRTDGQLEVTLTNHTDRTLLQAVVLFQGSPKSIGTVEPADTVTSELPSSVELDTVAWEYLVPAGGRQEHRAQILESLARRQRFETSDADQLMVVAWLSRPLVSTATSPPFESELPIQLVVISFPYEVWA